MTDDNDRCSFSSSIVCFHYRLLTSGLSRNIFAEMFGGEGVRYQNNEYSSSTLFLNTVLQASLSCRFLLHFYSCIHDDPIKAS